ncbi:DUF4013 domain-containing protein [Methanobacterium sp. ACI-7]|uniref:DUF4013 domain-containing protein n=1 Tax=unclassified Methanobacterium TaxID=2627676 RepID=UPI0039C1420D
MNNEDSKINLSEILSNSFRYPFSNVKRMLLLGLLLATSIFIIPGILAYGYFLRIIENSLNGSKDLPPFDNFGTMFVDGIKYIVVDIVYLGIPGVIVGFITTIIFIAIFPYAMAFTNFYLILGIVSIFLLAIPYLLSLIAFPNMVYNGIEVSKAFDFKNILRIIKVVSWKFYILAIMPLALYVVLTNLLGFFLQSLNLGLMIYVISGVISLFVGSYVLSFKGKLLSLLYLEGNGKGEDGE